VLVELDENAALLPQWGKTPVLGSDHKRTIVCFLLPLKNSRSFAGLQKQMTILENQYC